MKTSVSPDFECCPRFNPKPWDDVVLEWNDKQFVKASVCTIAFMPLNFGMVIRKLFKAIEKAGATAQDYLCLSDHASKWYMWQLLPKLTGKTNAATLPAVSLL